MRKSMKNAMYKSPTPNMMGMANPNEMYNQGPGVSSMLPTGMMPEMNMDDAMPRIKGKNLPNMEGDRRKASRSTKGKKAKKLKVGKKKK